jgi:hypothetical protein
MASAGQVVWTTTMMQEQLQSLQEAHTQNRVSKKQLKDHRQQIKDLRSAKNNEINQLKITNATATKQDYMSLAKFLYIQVPRTFRGSPTQKKFKGVLGSSFLFAQVVEKKQKKSYCICVR